MIGDDRRARPHDSSLSYRDPRSRHGSGTQIAIATDPDLARKVNAWSNANAVAKDPFVRDTCVLIDQSMLPDPHIGLQSGEAHHDSSGAKSHAWTDERARMYDHRGPKAGLIESPRNGAPDPRSTDRYQDLVDGGIRRGEKLGFLLNLQTCCLEARGLRDDESLHRPVEILSDSRDNGPRLQCRATTTDNPKAFHSWRFVVRRAQ